MKRGKTKLPLPANEKNAIGAMLYPDRASFGRAHDAPDANQPKGSCPCKSRIDAVDRPLISSGDKTR